jgi:hypothetical protein
MAGGRRYLLGLVHGHWNIRPEEMNEPQPKLVGNKEAGSVNMGIAVVIPSKKIREVLYHPDFVAERKNNEGSALVLRQPIPQPNPLVPGVPGAFPRPRRKR